MGKTKTFLVIILLIVFYATLPLFGKGFIPTHDGEYHIIRFWQFAKMLSSGYLFPRWAPDINSSYGMPLFIFHYPFPNYIGAFFHLFGISFVNSFKLALAFGYFTAVLVCFVWLSKLFRPFAAFVGTIIFSVVPYWFVDIYVRGSVGEVWAIAWFFVALFAVERKSFLFVSLATALLILSHNIMAMLLVPTLGLYLFIRNRRLLWGIGMGALLSAYFWIPALAEQKYMVGLNSVDYRDHFPLLVQLLIPSWGTGFSARAFTSDEMSFQIGIVPLLVFFLALVRRGGGVLHRSFSLLGVAAFFLMLEVSSFVWKVIPALPLLQYPWRLLVFVLPLTAFFSAWVASRYPRWVAIGMSVAALLLSARYMRPVIYAPRTDDHYLTRREFTDGTSSLGNSFSTIWTGSKSERPKEKIEVTEGSARISDLQIRPLDYTFKVDSLRDSRIAVRSLYYPGWSASVDGNQTPIEYQKEGIVEFVVPAGSHRVLVRFGETPIRIVADILSVSGLAVLAVLGYTSRYAYRHKLVSHVRRAQSSGHRTVHQRTH